MERSLSVLVVDDDPFVRSTLIRQLSTLGVADVAGAADGGEAGVCIAKKQPPYDVIITDLQMPGEDGLQLLRKLSSDHPGPAVILISGLDARMMRTAEEIARQRGIRIIGSVMKPVSTNTLQALLARASNPAEASVVPQPAQDIAPEELMAALASNQIQVAVQPQVRLLDGLACGVEALARWTRTNGEAVPPQQFVALAEKHHLISALTERVVRQAFDLAAGWQAAGLDLKVSVNLAPLNLAELDLPDRLLKLAQDIGIPSGRLVLEVTESGISGGAANVLEVLGRLRLAGFGISIDDFGTGYSSLQRLNWVPFTELKIDRSFVVAAPLDAKARSIVHSSLTLARDLGLTSVAEGVETAEQMEILRDMGCDVVQGFYLSKPLAPGDMASWVAARADAASAASR
ncbi:MAG: EAL domain-containing response regulator [Sinimarinibacterium sp.]|jgi:EAL domain-containing protein (putative c-di-GMP-specific phosphodiesterase class I)